MRSADLTNEIQQRLAALSAQLKLRGAGNMFDLHISCESFFCRILNTAYGYNLRNANDESENTPGFDLIDESRSLLVQVTTDTKRSKITSSIRKVPQKFAGYTIKFMFVSSEKPKRENAPIPNPANLKFTFGADEIYLTDLMRQIRTLGLDELEDLHAFVMRELDLTTPPNNLDSLLAQVVKSYNELPEPTSLQNDKYHRIKFAIDDKIIRNSLQDSRQRIQLVAPFVHAKLDGIYNQWAAEGRDVAPVVLHNFSASYAQLKNKIANPNNLYNEIISSQAKLVRSSSSCPEEIEIDRLEFCISVVMVDAFMRCLVFEGPNVRELEVNDDAPSQ